MTARHTAIETISNHKVASTQNYLEHAGEDIYGQYVFHEGAQRQYLAKPIYRRLRRTIEGLDGIDPDLTLKGLVHFHRVVSGDEAPA